MVWLSFPISTHDEACRYCEFAIACRTEHPPSRARIHGAELSRGYLALRSAK